MNIKIDDQLPIVGSVNAYVFEGDLPSTDLLAIIDDRSRPEWSRLVSEYHNSNLVTNAGRQLMTKLIVGETTVGIGYMALSTSVVAPALADTTLPNELIRSIVAVKQSISSYSQRYTTYFGTNAFNSTGINAEGLFDTATTGGNMFADSSITLSKLGTQSATVDHRITATTGV